jgi:hypothetical protein
MNRTQTVIVPRRFCGPDGMGNGGYVCGLVAAAIGNNARVRLRLPTPLDRALRLEGGDSEARLFDGEQLLAEGFGLDSPPDLDPPPRPIAVEIAEASVHFPAIGQHMAPNCFVCGNERDPRDALCIYSGRHPRSGHALAAWVPASDLGDDAGLVESRYLWAALDCPSYFTLGFHDRVALLADMSAGIVRRPHVGEDLTVTGWTLGHDGRKHHSASVIHDAEGRVVAMAKALWVDVGPVGA